MGLSKDTKSRKWIAQVGSGSLGTRKKRRFELKRDAEDWLLREESKLKDEKEGGQTPYMNIDDLLSQFIEANKDKTKSHLRDMTYSINEIKDQLSVNYIVDITAESLENFKAKSQHQPINLNKKIKHFKSMCRFAQKQGWYDFSKLDSVKPIKVKAAAKKVLNQNEVTELIQTAKENSPNVWYPIIFTFLNTGIRKRELVTLEWDDIDFDHNTLKIQPKPHLLIEGEPFLCKTEDSKRVIPLKRSLKEVLLNMERTSTLVFPNKLGNMRWNNFTREFSKIVKFTPIDKPELIKPHCLRHTFLSHLLVYGKVDLLTVSKLAGHSSVQTTEIYLHLLGGEDHKMSAIESLPDYGK